MATTKTTTARSGGGAATDAVIDQTRVSKPFYAYVGVADLAVSKLRTLPDFYAAGLHTAQAQVSTARGSVKTLPVIVREQLTSLPDKAKGTYSDLVKRGEKLVKTVRNSPNTKAAVTQAKSARSQAKGAATSVRRSVNSAEKAAEAAAAKIG